MKIIETPWQIGVLTICQKCGKSFDKPIDSEKIRSELKNKFKLQGISPAIRVLASTCLDVCEPNEQAVAYSPVDGPTVVSTFSGDNIEEQIESYAKELIKSQ